MPLKLPPNLAACLSVGNSRLIDISTPSLQAFLEKCCFMTLIAFEPDILGVRKKPPPEETPFAKNGRAEETPFHSLHTRKKPPR
ncbi:hypothetical protein DPMN_111179 [Dreissena polymorpha]|uniref:Uncharacterized protein n=1 Tax=Dreissena polymorpha TaxID=45954 RepID=A0A9D4QNR0_DREPO|nr:hypothetical protein DPMN_111179 [Dreissena polymorpha]